MQEKAYQRKPLLQALQSTDTNRFKLKFYDHPFYLHPLPYLFS